MWRSSLKLRMGSTYFIYIFLESKNSLECPLRTLHSTDKPNLWSLASSSPSELHSVVLPTNAKESIQHSYTKLHGYFKAPLFKTQELPLMCTFQLSNQCWSIFFSLENKKSSSFSCFPIQQIHIYHICSSSILWLYRAAFYSKFHCFCKPLSMKKEAN